MYIELHTASAFSFLGAASLPEAIVARAAALGYPALALLDRDGVYGAPRFYRAAKAAGIRPIVGAELTMGAGVADLDSRTARSAAAHPVGPRAEWSEPDRERNGAKPGFGAEPHLSWPLPVLVESQEGYRNLCRLVTRMKLRAPKGEGALALEDLDGSTQGLVALVGREALDAGRYGVGGLLDRIVGLFGRSQVCVELQRHLLRDEEAANESLIALAAAFRVPVVATNGVRFATPAERPLFDVLTCIRHHTDVDRAGRRLARNAERYLKSPAAMARLFADRPEALTAAADLADRLHFTMADLGYRFPEYPVPAGETMSSFLRKMTEVGARHRYRPYHDRARAQIARELDLIEKLDLAGYFLIVWDIVNFCRQHDILVQGRGSAANSAVCYSLGITAVDPVGMDLLFERFLSEERGEWPDIDLDLPSGDRRERVIQYLYERYGRLGAAMTANVITYRDRSAAREVGKVLGIEPAQVDRLAKVMHNFEFRDSTETLDGHLRTVGLEGGDRVRLFADLWRQIQDLPRHLGQHSGGMVVCRGRLDTVVPLENASMPGRVVIQWDKDDCADLGIVKVDLLGLGMMAVLQEALALVNTGRLGAPAAGAEGESASPEAPARGGGVPRALRCASDSSVDSRPRLDLAHLPPDDPAVYAMLQEADTVGVFQVESRAQMATLPRLKPERFYDLVVEVAIIRPGPIVGQMVHPYLNRRAGREPVTYLHPSLEPILKRTLGVPLFQEQLLRMAMEVAGFTGGQAEELRRAMGFKRSMARMQQIEAHLRAGMATRGITGGAADQIVTSITSFALYGFPESHAASFALLAYASAYLKVHYPAAFYTALLNNQPMGFYNPATLVKDAQRRGVRFAGIDVQRSDWRCTVEEDGTIRLGLCYVRGLRESVGRAIERLRPARGAEPPSARERGRGPASVEKGRRPLPAAGGPQTLSRLESRAPNPESRPASAPAPAGRFVSIDDLAARSGARRDELAALADVGALNALGQGDRRTALWQIERAVKPAGELYRQDDGDEEPSPLPAMTPIERVEADYAGTGLTIGPHPMMLRRTELAMRGALRAVDLSRVRHGRRVRVAGAVITRQRPGTAKGFVFLTLEDETGLANIIIRPDLFVRDRLAILEQPYLLIDGVLQSQDGAVSIRAERVQGLGLTTAAPESHDFH
jgi:error-prone DNA polymerase